MLCLIFAFLFTICLSPILIKVDFSPETVFNALYLGYCSAAWHTKTEADTEGNCLSILAHFSHLFTLLSPTNTSAAIRREALVSHHRRWPGLHSTTTCYFCLCRSPEHMLPCRHSICDTCVVIFGTVGKSAEYHVDISSCPMCEKSFQLTIRQLPPTKCPVILSLDGGGVRGIIQLGLLRALEKRLGKTYGCRRYLICAWAPASVSGFKN